MSIADPCSPIEHLAKAVWISRYSKANLFGMFTSYFDDAGGKDHGFTVVSGYLASAYAWERFEADWRILLARYDIPYFHMKEFSQSNGPFQAWKEEETKRANLLRLAAEIIKATVMQSYASVVNHADFESVNQKYELDRFVGNPYSLAGRSCAAHATQWLRARERNLPVKYVFEDGTKGKGLLMRIMKRDELPVPIFAPSRDRENEKGLLPLQAADFAAYEIRKIRKDDPGEEWPLYKHRKSLKALASIPGWWGEYKEKDLLTFCKSASVPLRKSRQSPSEMQ